MKILNEIRLDNLRGDLFGGVTAAIVALPMALAFGVASGAGPAAGLYGAVLVGLFAALFGGTPTLMSEPTGPMTVVMTAVIAKLVASDPVNGMAMAFTAVMLAGLIQMAFGLLRLGQYVTLMPATVISGFMSGIGIILIVLQIPALLGHASPDGGVLGSLLALPNFLGSVVPGEAGLAALTLAILFLMPGRLKRLVPPQLVALIAATLLSIWLIGGDDVRRIGEIETGLPSLQLPVFSMAQLETIIIDALVLAMLGSIDALLSSMIADSLTRKQHNSDKELFGQGLGNLASGLFGGLPGAGATMGTVVNIQAGGRSALAGLTRAGLLIIVVLWAGGLTAHIPLAVLAAIAVKVGFDIIDWPLLQRAHRVSLRGALIMYGVIGLTVFVDLIVAVGIGVFVANILTIKRLAELQEETVCVCSGDSTRAEGAMHLTPEEKALLQQAEGRVTLLQLSGPMIFAAANALKRHGPVLQEAETLVIDLTDVPYMGVTTSLALEAVVRDAVRRGAPVYLVGLQEQPKKRFERLGIDELLERSRWLDDRCEALSYAGASVANAAG